MFRGIYRGKKAHRPDLDRVLTRCKENGMQKMIITAGNLEDLRGNLDLIEQHPECGIKLTTTVGVHPTRVMELENDPSLVSRLLEAWKGAGETISAVGEFGLDYDRLQFAPRDIQIKWFKEQFVLARETKLPLFLHMRNACKDFVRVIQEHRADFCEGVVHSFTGNCEDAQAILQQNLWIGINGCSLKCQETLDAIRDVIPLERLMIESDAPWCEIRKSHVGFPLVQTHFTSIAKEKYDESSNPYLWVKSRNEPLATRSEGQLPHFLQFDYHKRPSLVSMDIYMDFMRDESYTPLEISLLAGDHAGNVHEWGTWSVQDVNGWRTIPLTHPDGSPLRCFSLRLVVRANNNNGRDSRIHGVKFNSA